MLWSEGINSHRIYESIVVDNHDQRTTGPVNAHLKPDLGVLSHNEMTLTSHTYSHTFIDFISCLHLQSFRSQAAIVSKPSDF